jgi:Flagellar motor switch/type III secretory pathway protein
MDENNAAGTSQSPLLSVPVEVIVSVGKARPMVRDLLSLGRDSIISLDRRIDDPVDLYIGDKLIARGELTDTSTDGAESLAVRITEIVNIQDNP